MTTTVTPIRSPGASDPDLTEAIAEQQSRVGRLCALLQCVREAPHDQVDDLEAAISGLIDYAEAIHQELDAGALKQRAQELAEEKQP